MKVIKNRKPVKTEKKTGKNAGKGITEEDILKAMIICDGVITSVASYLNCSYSSIYKRLKTCPKIVEIYNSMWEQKLESIMQRLIDELNEPGLLLLETSFNHLKLLTECIQKQIDKNDRHLCLLKETESKTSDNDNSVNLIFNVIDNKE